MCTAGRTKSLNDPSVRIVNEANKSGNTVPNLAKGKTTVSKIIKSRNQARSSLRIPQGNLTYGQV
jgi:hypothetical protein